MHMNDCFQNAADAENVFNTKLAVVISLSIKPRSMIGQHELTKRREVDIRRKNLL